jgi:hypothetical protein
MLNPLYDRSLARLDHFHSTTLENARNQVTALYEISSIPWSLVTEPSEVIPTAWLHSWLLYLGIQTHFRSNIDSELKPLHNVCECLSAPHIQKRLVREMPIS